MHRRLDTALAALRQDLPGWIADDAVHDACRDLGHRWRDCRLTPAAVVRCLLLQVLHGNTALEHVALLGGRAFTGSAYGQARARLPLELLRRLLRLLVDRLAPASRADAGGTWRGHRTLLVDGSSFSMPDTPELQAHFGQPGGQAAGCGFPVARILALFHAGTGLLMQVIPAPLRSHEMSRLDAVHPALRPGDVLVGDRGFCSFAHLALLAGRGVHAVFRVHQKQIVDFTPGRPAAAGRRGEAGRPRSHWRRSLGPLDQVVAWIRPEAPPDWMTRERFDALPATLELRELRYEVGRPGFRTRHVTLVTTLLDPGAYPAAALAERYGVRWRVEGHLRELEQTLGMDVLKCRTVAGVPKELHAFAIAYNLVRLAMGVAAGRRGVAVERLSFQDALRWLRDSGAAELLARLVLLPTRPGRSEPRVRKRRPKQYPLMKRPRAALRQAMLNAALPA
jgi:hypothetical protein